MRTLCWLSPGSRQILGNDLLEALCAIYPEGRRGSQGHVFFGKIDVADSRLRMLLATLQAAGLSPWVDRSRMPVNGKEYSEKYERIYAGEDLLTHEMLELWPVGHLMCVSGECRRPGSDTSIKAPCRSDIGSIDVCGSCHIAVQRVRDALESANLLGLKFLPVEKQYESVDYNLYDEEDTWWELESDIELPPVAPSVQLLTRDYKPFRGDFTEGCQRIEDLQMYPELHYRRSDLDRFGPFDVARTYEHFFPKGPAPMHRAMIVSRKFYRICRDNGFRTRFLPVHVDDE